MPRTPETATAAARALEEHADRVSRSDRRWLDGVPIAAEDPDGEATVVNEESQLEPDEEERLAFDQLVPDGLNDEANVPDPADKYVSPV